MIQKVLGIDLCYLDTKLNIKGKIMYFLVYASPPKPLDAAPPKPLDVATLNFADA